MLVVLSDSDFRSGEAKLVNQLFHAGLDLFHIRKYGADGKSLSEWIQQIDPAYRSRLVLHHDHQLGRMTGLKRFHYSEKDRELWSQQDWNGLDRECVYSTSVHTLEAFNCLPEHFSYAFLSPVFDSISKTAYKAVTFDLSKRRNKHTKLIALGGIHRNNISDVCRMGFEGAALLGAIWESPDPVDEWNCCKEMVSGFSFRREIQERV